MAVESHHRVDARYCKRCTYLSKTSFVPYCAYLIREGHSRGCPAGKGCVRKKTMRKARCG